MTTSSAQALYAHIHCLLDEHVAVHLATDYVDCTQGRVFQALTGGLLPVSVDDPHSLVLPSDPLDDLVKEYCQIELKDTYERLTAVKKAQELIWSSINTKPIERTFPSRFNDTFCDYSDFFADPSVLSVHSICHTPKPGRNKKPHFVPLNMREVLSPNLVKPASVEEDKDTDAQTEDLLHCRLAVDRHSWKEILLSYQASPFSTTHTSETESRVCNKFLFRTPSPPLLAPLPQTPPLFSRKNIAPKQPAHVPASVLDLQLVTPSKGSDGDDETLEYAVDDEWAVSSTLTPPSPCLKSPSKQNDFFVLSSESQGPVDDLLAAKMDMFYMPRQSRVGGSCEVFRVPGQGQQLHEYIGSAVCSTRGQNDTTTLSSTSSIIVTPLTSVHRAGTFPTPDNMCHSSDDSFLGQLIIEFADEAIDTVLLDPSTDTGSDLMNVPHLPAPNVHTHDTVWPNDMKSLITYKAFSTFDAVKGIKSLNLELSWRPYESEQAIPTVEELVGVSQVHYSVDGEEAKSQLAELLKWLNSITQPISVEESRGKFQVPLKSITNFNSATVEPDPPDCEVSNVLPTRAERLRSRLPPRNQLQGTCGRAGQWDKGNYTTAQPQSLGRSKVHSPSEDNNHVQRTEPDSVDLRTFVSGRTLLSEDVALDAELDIVSAPQVQLPAESITSLSPAGLFLNSDPISSLESSKGPNSDRIHPSKPDGLESNHWPTSFELATCEEQSLQGYLKILAKHPPSGQANNDMHLSTSPACSELRRLSTSPADTEGLLRELSKIAAPLPPSGASSQHNHRYLASVELLQDRPLMRALCPDSLRMELVEREWVDGADIVFDCDTALVFVPLSQVLLPSGLGSLKDRLSSLSWQYTHLAVVFKLYDAGISGLQRSQDEEERMELSSQVIRSIKKLQRGLALAEVYAIKRPQTVILMYFVQSVEQAAATTRTLGDVAESRSQFSPWGDRLWLGVDEKEEERYLAGVDGMNAFAAAVILSQISLHNFLALRADQRLQLVLPIPVSMMERFNEFIAQRHEDVDTFVEDEDGAY